MSYLVPDSPYPWGLLTWGYQNRSDLESVRLCVPVHGEKVNIQIWIPVHGLTKENRALDLSIKLKNLGIIADQIAKDFQAMDPKVYDDWFAKVQANAKKSDLQRIKEQIVALEQDISHE